MQICLISYARPMRFPCTSRVCLPTFCLSLLKYSRKCPTLFSLGLTSRVCGVVEGGAFRDLYFQPPFSHFPCGGGGKVVFLPYLFFCLLPWRGEFSRGRREQAGCCGEGIDFRCCFPPPFLHFPFLPFRPFWKAGKGEKL